MISFDSPGLGGDIRGVGKEKKEGGKADSLSSFHRRTLVSLELLRKKRAGGKHKRERRKYLKFYNCVDSGDNLCSDLKRVTLEFI